MGKTIKDLDKEKYPTLCGIFEKIDQSNNFDIYEKNLNTLPKFMTEIFNLTKETHTEIILNNAKQITKPNTQEFLDETNTQKGLKVGYEISKNGVDGYIEYNINNDKDREYDFKKFADNNPNLSHDIMLYEYTNSRLEDLMGGFSLMYMSIDFLEYGIKFYFYLDQQQKYCPKTNNWDSIRFCWSGDVYIVKYI